MGETRSQALKEVFATWKARLFVGIPMAAGAYQFGCDQLDWPKLPVLWDMTGALFPWWGWVLVAQAGFVFALFEYVRRNVGIQTPPASSLIDEERVKAMVAEHVAARGVGAVVAPKLTADQESRLEQASRGNSENRQRIDNALKRLDAIEQFVSMLTDERRRADARLSLEKWEKKPFRKPGDNLYSEYANAKTTGYLYKELFAFGVEKDVLDKIRNDIRTTVLADAKYLHLSEADAKIYGSGETKRTHTMSEMYYNALLKILEEIANGKR